LEVEDFLAFFFFLALWVVFAAGALLLEAAVAAEVLEVEVSAAIALTANIAAIIEITSFIKYPFKVIPISSGVVTYNRATVVPCAILIISRL
jgi:hypothetical protein